jgi:hypothetical protein
MYALDGVSLNNDAYGWYLTPESEIAFEYSMNRSSVQFPGRDGVEPSPGWLEGTTSKLVIECPLSAQGTVLALLRSGKQLTSEASGYVLDVEFMTSAVVDLNTFPAMCEITAVFRTRTAWRDPLEATSAPAALTAASVTVDVLSGLSMPVRDAILRVGGAVTGLLITDSSGEWVSYGASLPAGSYWRFHADTGRAFVTATNTWTGGTEVTGTSDWSGTGTPFQIEPMRPTPTDPIIRVGRLTVATATRSGATLEVRARRAFAAA